MAPGDDIASIDVPVEINEKVSAAKMER